MYKAAFTPDAKQIFQQIDTNNISSAMAEITTVLYMLWKSQIRRNFTELYSLYLASHTSAEFIWFTTAVWTQKQIVLWFNCNKLGLVKVYFFRGFFGTFFRLFFFFFYVFQTLFRLLFSNIFQTSFFKLFFFYLFQTFFTDIFSDFFLGPFSEFFFFYLF